MIIEIHALQALGPSALNLDENGFPKMMILGETRRGRISSQAQKRAIRKWAEAQAPATRGIRTTHLRDRLFLPRFQKLVDLNLYSEQAVATIANRVVAAFGGKLSDDGTLASSIFTWPGEIELLAKLSAERATELLDESQWKKVAAQLAQTVATANLSKPFSIAAFGRMIAALPAGEIDGAVAFSHAYTTHNVFLNVDNFVAIDDLAETSEASAFLLNEQPFLAPSVFYRHFSIETTLLQNNLGSGLTTVEAVKLILEAFWQAVPSGGKQRAFKADDKPQFVLATVNGDGCSRGSAFMAPVRDERDMLVASIKQFDDAWRRSELMRRRPDGQKIYTATGYPDALDYLRGTVVTGGYDKLMEQVSLSLGTPTDAVAGT